MSNDRLMLGFHRSGNNFYNEYEGLMNSTQQPVHTWVGSPTAFWQMEELHAAQPDCIITARQTDYENYYKDRLTARTDPKEAGKQWALLLIESGINRYAYWRTDEWGIGDDDWKVQFTLAAMQVFLGSGHRMGVGNYSEGNPQVIPYDGVNGWERWLPVLRMVNDHPDQFIVTLNCYRVDGHDDAHLLRFHYLIEFCHAHGLYNVRIALGEVGVDDPLIQKRPDHPGAKDENEWMLGHFFEINDLLAQYPELYGGAIFTLDRTDSGTGRYRLVTLHDKGRDETILMGLVNLAATKVIRHSKPGSSPQPQPQPQPEPQPEPQPQPTPDPVETVVYDNDFSNPKHHFEITVDPTGDRMIPEGLMLDYKTGKNFDLTHGEFSPSLSITQTPDSYIFWGKRFDAALGVKFTRQPGVRYRISVTSSGKGDGTVDRRLAVDFDGGDDLFVKLPDNQIVSENQMNTDPDTLSYEFDANVEMPVTVIWRVVSKDKEVSRNEAKIDRITITALPAADPEPEPEPTPEPAPSGAYKAKARAIVFVRKGPGTEYDKEWEFLPEETIWLTGETHGPWLRIEDRPSFTDCWVHGDYVEKVS